MNSSRRHRSEHIPYTTPATRRYIPPHKAAKLREAQIRRRQADQGHSHHVLALAGASKTGGISNTSKAAERHSSAPDALQRLLSALPFLKSQTFEQDTTSASAEEKKTLKPSSKQRQLDGADHLPNIDAVIAAARDPDQNKAMAEAMYNEHKADNGAVKRRSLVRTVDRDDCLVARGANPRTGLITPDGNSLAGSLESERLHRAQRQDQSAQWRLDGNQWISVEQATQSPQPLVVQSPPPGVSKNQPANRHQNNTALAEDNLRSLSDHTDPVTKQGVVSPPQELPLSVNKIRRKPIPPSPLPTPPEILSQERVRFPSDETVVKRPPGKRKGDRDGARYFSPEDVGRAIHSQPKSQPGQSFLEMPVKSRDLLTAPSRGFTARNDDLGQLQHCLRTSSGRYPSPPSTNRIIPTSKFEHLVPLRKRGDASERAVLSPSIAPRACRPSAATSYMQQRQQLPPRDFLRNTNGPRKRIASGAGTLLPYPEGHRLQMQVNGDDIKQTSDTMSMTTSTRIPMSSGHTKQSQDCCPRDLMPLRRDFRSEHACQVQADLDHLPATSCDCNTMAQDPFPTMQGRRPPLGPRKDETVDILRSVGDEMVTTTGSKGPSNRTGTAAGPRWSDDTASGEEDGPQVENRPPCPIDRGGPLLDAAQSPAKNQLNLLEAHENQRRADRYAVPEPGDHSICCPQCCIQFDCHRGCLGHSSPGASIAGGETSSLRSMRAFDASFETSVKAVNSVLLTPPGTRDSKLARLRAALIGARPPPRGTSKPRPMKRSLKDPPPAPWKTKNGERMVTVKGNSNACEGPKQARKAAVKALEDNACCSDYLSEATIPAVQERRSEVPPKTAKHVNAIQPVTMAANEARKVSTKLDRPVQLPISASEETLVNTAHEGRTAAQPGAVEPALKREDGSVISRVSTLIRHRSIFRFSYVQEQGLMFSHAHAAARRAQEMIVVVLDTISVVVSIAFEYNRSGVLALPAGITASELLANVLRSLVYLMIVACLYAVLFRLARMLLVVVRIVLLPVRVVAWIIG